MKNMLRAICALLLTLYFAFSAGADQVFFYHTDSLGTPLAMTDASGAKVWEADYMPFGEEYSVWSSSTDIENNKRFIGNEKDAETGFNYFGARYLSTDIGRFLAPDPVRAVDPQTGDINEKIIKNAQRLNLYCYGLNNPYKYIDPLGLDPYLMVYFSGSYAIEVGKVYAANLDNGSVHEYNYLGVPVYSRGRNGALIAQMGIADLEKPDSFDKWGLEIGFITRNNGPFGAAFQLSLDGPSDESLLNDVPDDTRSWAVAYGPSMSIGDSFSVMITHSTYKGEVPQEKIPAAVKDAIKKGTEIYQKTKR